MYFKNTAAPTGTDLTIWTPLPAGPSPYPFSTSLPKEFFRLKK